MSMPVEHDPHRLLPDAPPQRLPEEELLATLERDKAYRRNASLLPSKGTRELRYRMVAVFTSLALLIGMVNFAPFNFLSLAGRATAEPTTGSANYTWLTKNTGTQADPYKIGTQGELDALAQLVAGLPVPATTTTRNLPAAPTMTIIIDGYTFVVGPEQENKLPESLLPPEETPIPTEAPTEAPSAVPTAEPTEAPTETPPAESPSTPPTATPSATPSAEPEPTPEALPSVLPEILEPPVPAAPLPLMHLLEVAPSVAPSSPAVETTPAETPPVEPPPVETPPVETTPAETPPVETTPAETPPVETTPVETPPVETTPAETPPVETTPAETPPSPSSSGNSEGLFGDGGSAVYSLTVPVGMAGCYFELTANLDLYDYRGQTAGGSLYYWTPIGLLSSFDAAGNATGTPFLGNFDGKNYTVYNFYYAPNPATVGFDGAGTTAPSTAGFGLFGYVGTTGVVKNLTVRTASTATDHGDSIPWVLSDVQQLEGSVVVTKELPLGGRNYAVGVLAAASSGTLSGCTVTQANMSYRFEPRLDATHSTAIGGLVGLVAGGSLENCAFLGAISNVVPAVITVSTTTKLPLVDNTYTRQSVGGVAGFVSARAALTQCAAGVDIDIFNGGIPAKAGGVGGLYGYASAALTLKSSFTTGTVRANHNTGGVGGYASAVVTYTDGYSTAAVGFSGKTAATTTSYKVENTTTIDEGTSPLSKSEAIGGLFGSLAASNNELTNLYFAGSLLEPQFGAIAGWMSTATLTQVATDGTQAPHGFYKNLADPTSAPRDLSGFSSWTAPAEGHNPQFALTAPSATLTALSKAATLPWAAVTADNAYSVADGSRNLYQLKDAALTTNSFGATKVTMYTDTTGASIGGEYQRTETVDGTPIPLLRSALSAVNQAELLANTISDGATLLRFANRVNQAPGGYNGSLYRFADGTSPATGVALPAYSRAALKPFCGTLEGGTSSALDGFTYAAGATGLIDTACDADLRNFTLQNVNIGDVPLGRRESGGSAGYGGFAVGQLVRSHLTNVDIDTLTYAYSDANDSTSHYGGTPIGLGLVGKIPAANDTRVTFTDCDLREVNVSFLVAKPNGGLGVYFGGIVGTTDEKAGTASSLTMTNCSMRGSIFADFSTANSTTSFPHIGGLLGFDNNNSFSMGTSGNYALFSGCTVNADLRGGRVGGLIGRGRSATLNDCVFYGSVATSKLFSSVTANNIASGGLIGANQHGSATIAMTRCAVLGNISSTFNAGGLIGITHKSPIVKDSYVSGIVSTTVTGAGAAGGLMGTHQGSNEHLSFTNSYFVGQVTSSSLKGAIIGQSTHALSVTLDGVRYDSSLMPKGTLTAGSASNTPASSPTTPKPVPVTVSVPDCATAPDSTAWDTLAATAPWVAETGHYPQLQALRTSASTFSYLSTLRLFDEIQSGGTIHEIPLARPFSTVLPTDGSVVGTPAANVPFAQIGTITSDATLTTTPYEMNNADISEGVLNLTYQHTNLGGRPLNLPYTLGVKLFDVGSGTATSPYIIYDLEQLKVFRIFINSKKNQPDIYYQISTKEKNANGVYESIEIEMTEANGTPLNWRGTSTALTGHLDGFGSTLSSFYTSGWVTDSRWAAGLLGGLAPGCSVKDLTLLGAPSGAIVDTEDRAGDNHTAGLLSATAAGGTITNVTAKGAIVADRDTVVGGLIGTASVSSSLGITRCVTDVALTARGGNGGNSIGAGGLIGQLDSSGHVTISESATYGSFVDWGAMGGVLGRVDNSKGLQLTVKNTYSLVHFSDTKVSSSVLCGGIIGSVDTLLLTGDGRTTIEACYYAGENALTKTSGRTVGGIVGGAKASSTGDSSLSHNGMDYLKLNIVNSAYNTDGNSVTPANLYYKTTSGTVDTYQYNSRYAWPEESDKAGETARPGYGTPYPGSETSFTMSMDTANRTGVMANWLPTTWTFHDGLYPLLSGVPVTGDLAFQHLAIHYTQSNGTDRYTNVFVRYTGAQLSSASTSLRVTENQRMAVAIDNNSTTKVDVRIDATIAGVTGSRIIQLIPSVSSRGYRDASIYYANPDGMWPTTDGKNVWQVYTTDALAGLATIYSSDTTDQNGIPELSRDDLKGGQIWLARDLDLSEGYTGMSSYNTWRSIGADAANAFDLVLDGKGHTLYDLTMNPFYRHHQNDTESLYDLNHKGEPAVPADMSASLGLFGYIDGGTVRNVVLATTADSTKTSLFDQPGVRVAQGVTAAGALAAVVKDGTLENCLVSVPVYTLGTVEGTDDWSHIPYLGAAANTPMGGLVGQVQGTTTLKDCAYTGYVYADPKNPRPGSDQPALTAPTTGPVGGLVGQLDAGATLTVTDSYAAGYTFGTSPGALIGKSIGTTTFSGAYFDQNATGGSVQAVGEGSASGTADNQIPAVVGAGWSTAPAGLYPLQTALAAYEGTLATRIKVDLVPHAGSTTAGTLAYTENGATLVYKNAPQPGVSHTPGTLTQTGNSFVKLTDGPVQLQLQQATAARRVLVNLRCWYDDFTVVDGVKHYTISTAEELWELAELVSGAIGTTASKVTHSHTLPGGFDNFDAAVVQLAADVDLATLTDTPASTDGTAVPRPWLPIGTTHPFAGTFMGGGHAVSGMLLAGTAESGLFGTLAGTVRDLLVTNASMTLTSPSALGGLLCARLTATGSLLGIGSSGMATATGSGAVLGGLVGTSAGVIVDCYSTAELTLPNNIAAQSVGGLVGSLTAGSLTRSYFTGLCSAPSAAEVGGLVANYGSGSVTDCYVSAYLDGAVTYGTLKNPSPTCVYDGRHTTEGGESGRVNDQISMQGGWSDKTASYYPIPTYFTTGDVAGSPLSQGAQAAAAIFSFTSSTGSPNYLRFRTVINSTAVDGGHFLRSGNPLLLTVSGNEARAVSDSNGTVILRLCLGNSERVDFQRPCWLGIPAELAVTYRFNWDSFIDTSKLNPNYSPTNADYNPTKSIRTVADWNAFVARVNRSADGGLSELVRLERDLTFGGGTISTITVPFRGTFHGGNHTLSNFRTALPLFASVERGATVEMLGLSGGTLSVSITGGVEHATALVAGENRGRIANVAVDSCTVSLTQSTTLDTPTFLGGLVGKNEGTLDSCYFYTPTTTNSSTSQITAHYPATTTPTKLRMGGLAGLNAGTITGCYVAFTPLCYIGGNFTGNTAYYAALAGLNDGGSIRYSYWRFAYDYNAQITLTSYRNSDGTFAAGSTYYAGTTDLELTARWLSADSYGGTYYVDGGRLKLYSFKLARYDLSEALGTPQEQYLMLALQFGVGDNAMASNAVCSWKDYLLPNFANLPLTSSLMVRMPLMGSSLTYTLTHAYAFTKDTADLKPLTESVVYGSALAGFAVTNPNSTTRVFLDITLSKDANGEPWGVYRKDTTLPAE